MAHSGGSVGKLHVDQSRKLYYRNLEKLLKIHGECPASSWRKCLDIFGITGFLDFVHHPVLKKKLKKTRCLRLAFSKKPNRVGVSPLT
jgi:hypothetical protein